MVMAALRQSPGRSSVASSGRCSPSPTKANKTMRAKGRDGLGVVKFGAPWCTHCAEMLPEFGDASRKYPDAHFVLADVDTLPETAEHVRFTPTFTFYRKGRKVDEIAKIKPRALRDRMWMHADDPEEEPHK